MAGWWQRTLFLLQWTPSLSRTVLLCQGQHRKGAEDRESPQPPVPTRSPVGLSPGACPPPATSCFIRSLGTFRYLLQLHTWNQREGEVGESVARLPRQPLPCNGHPRAAPSPVHHEVGVAEQHQAEILGFTSHKSLFSRAVLLHVFSHFFMPGCQSHCPPLADLTPSPTQCQETPETEVASKHGADAQSSGCGFKICSLLSHGSRGGWRQTPKPWGPGWLCSA